MMPSDSCLLNRWMASQIRKTTGIFPRIESLLRVRYSLETVATVMDSCSCKLYAGAGAGSAVAVLAEAARDPSTPVAIAAACALATFCDTLRQLLSCGEPAQASQQGLAAGGDGGGGDGGGSAAMSFSVWQDFLAGVFRPN